MRFLPGIACLLLLAAGVIPPATLSAQPTRPGRPETDQQKSGEALFQQNCALCHVHSNTKKRLGTTAMTDLIGLFKKPSVTDASVRQFILEGLPRQMPSFQYALVPKELDDLMAYLRIR